MAKTMLQSTIGKGALTRRYGGHAAALLSERGFLKEKPTPRGKQAQYQILKQLPSEVDFAGWLAEKYQTSVAALVSDAFSDVQSLRDEMGDWRDNLEEHFSQTPKYDEVGECVDALDAVADNEPDIPTIAGALPLVFIPPPATRNISRGDRLGIAIRQLRAASEELADWARHNGEHDEATEATEASDELENTIGELEGISFPGMY